MSTIRVSLSLFSFAFLLCVGQGAQITFTNNCPYTVWPGTQSGATSPQLSSTGFELASGASNTLELPSGWSGKFWARTGCSNNNGVFSCTTADCGNHVECGGAGEATPASLIEITTGNNNGAQDFYDVSNVDGFNVPSSMSPQGGSGACGTASCPVNINAACPAELQFKGSDKSVVGCKSACVIFNTPEYCCNGDHNTPQTCPPTNYSQFFSQQCPNAYSYAYDDKRGTFTCSGNPSYVLKFCP
ncbi:thaumatin-like protein 1b [Arachis hypogaea]|uniref:thaumatin-like protein 1b n=1 Tax=Arachis hypogaea TaxID=3818 RepID=UPI000DECF8B4|nr:thaumatin-like protein 1b [Arachis hypogaea]XP_025635455.1 thaumatin-like protein 1b [Arachis hypogaea]QHO26055.1 Thaumatin-like protein 1a [Arachis hypogaea]